MKISLRTISSIIACVFLAGISYFWATSLMASVYDFRSPVRSSPPKPGPALGNPLTKRVIFVLIDALRQDTSMKADVMPYLNELRQKGAWATMHSQPPSYSEPAYTTLLTGAWPYVSDGPTINLDYPDIPTFTQDDLVSAVHRAGLKTAVSGYYWFEKLIPQASVSASFYTPGEDRVADRQVVDAALPWIRDGAYQFILIHIDQVDYAGHYEGGVVSPGWDAAAKRSDDLLREITTSIDFSQDTLLVCSDHGQIDQGGHGGQDAITLIEPFLLVGAGVKPGHYPDVAMVDVAPTLAALLGANIPATSQGRVLTDMLSVNPEQLSSLQNAVTLQQSQMVSAYQAAIGKHVDAKSGGDVVSSQQAALQAAKTSRLQAERLPRALVALVAALLPLGMIFFIHRQKPIQVRNLAAVLGSALIYILVFNFRYAVLDRRTYSLSSVTGAMDLIIYIAITAGIAFVISWIVLILGTGALTRSRRDAGQAVLDFSLVVLYLLALPVLFSFYLNGALVTWTLPDFASMFVAFLSLFQILLVAVYGMLLAGITALLARRNPVKARQAGIIPTGRV